MAAVYLHNALYARNPPKNENSFVHSRNLSTVSNTTFITSTTVHSQPTEPLLTATTPPRANYDDRIDHIPRNREETTNPCEDTLMIDDNPINEAEKGYCASNCSKPLKRWKWLKLALQVSLSAWAIHNTVRYILAFTNSSDSTNQAFCLVLGTSTGFSFLLAFISSLIAIRDSNAHGVTPSYLAYVRLTLEYLSSFCLLGPAVANFVVIFIRKHLGNRCHLDIDVFWSVSSTLCNKRSPEWAIWLTLSTLRLVLTLIIIIGYHVISSLCYGSCRQRAIPRFRARTSPHSTPDESVPLSPNLPLHRDSNMQYHLSESTLCGTAMGESSPQNQLRLARSHSSGLSRDISPAEPTTLGHSTVTGSENEHVPNEFLDQFQSVISQIAHETDEALDLAHSGNSPSPEIMNDSPTQDLPPLYEEDSDDFGSTHNNGNNIFNLPRLLPVLGYNEFGLPYPPDQNVRVLNGYIRRMPTIESMGSGELGSISASSNRAGESIFTSSRPPTRNTLLSSSYSTDYDPASSEPPSRANSLSVRAELLVGLSSIGSTTSEHGELLGRTSPMARRLSTPISYVDYALSDTYSSATTGSRGTSYHTATSESFPPPPGLTMDTQLRSTPVWRQQDIIISDSEQQQQQPL